MVQSSSSVQYQSTFSGLPAAPKRSRKDCKQGTRQEGIVAKSKPTLNLVSHTAASSPTAPSSSAPSRLILRAQVSKVRISQHDSAAKPAVGGPNQNDTASCSTSVADRCKDERTCEETCCCRNKQGSEFSRSCTEICRSFQIIQNLFNGTTNPLPRRTWVTCLSHPNPS